MLCQYFLFSSLPRFFQSGLPAQDSRVFRVLTDPFLLTVLDREPVGLLLASTFDSSTERLRPSIWRWNWIVGRGLQGFLTFIAYRVFQDALLRAVELTPLIRGLCCLGTVFH
jgi:hypothetical protein